MTDPTQYFSTQAVPEERGKAAWVAWQDLDPIEIVSGIQFRCVLADNVMVNFVHLEPDSEAPVHWHDEEQISFVIDGEFEFEAGGEKRILRRGEAVVIPANVPHGARALDTPCLEVDVFYPPRRGLLEASGPRPPDIDISSPEGR